VYKGVIVETKTRFVVSYDDGQRSQTKEFLNLTEAIAIAKLWNTRVKKITTLEEWMDG